MPPHDARALVHAGPRVRVRVSSADGKMGIDGYALVDTGSAMSLLSTTVATQLGLPATSSVSVVMLATAAAHLATHSGLLSFPDSDLPSIRLSLVGVDLPDDAFVVILGRDFLAQAVLVYDGIGGAFSLTVPRAASPA